MKVEYQLAVLGGRFECASIKRDFDTMHTISKQINNIAQANEEVWAESWVVHGRNVVRERRGMESMHV